MPDYAIRSDQKLENITKPSLSNIAFARTTKWRVVYMLQK